MFNRSDKLVARCLREVALTDRVTNEDAICDEASNIQKELALNYFALPKETTLTLEAGKEKYDLNGKVYKIRSIEVPVTWAMELVFASSPEDYIKLKEAAASYPGQPTLMMVHDNYLKMYYPPQITGEKLTVYMFAVPSYDITEDKEPEVLDVWDNALFYGVMKNLGITTQDFESKFITEAKARKFDVMKPTTKSIQKEHFTDGIGF